MLLTELTIQVSIECRLFRHCARAFPSTKVVRQFVIGSALLSFLSRWLEWIHYLFVVLQDLLHAIVCKSVHGFGLFIQHCNCIWGDRMVAWPLNRGHSDSKGVSQRHVVIVLLLVLHLLHLLVVGSGVLDVLIESSGCLRVGWVGVDFCSYKSVVGLRQLFVLSELAYALILVDLHLVSWHKCDDLWLRWRIESISLRRDSLFALLCLLLLIFVVVSAAIKE